MSDAIISIVAERLTAIIGDQIRSEINLVRGVKKEVLHLSNELKKVRNYLEDADRRGFKEKSIKHWLKMLEDTSYEMDDVLDEWNISLLKLQRGKRNASIPPPKQKVSSFIQFFSCLSFKKVATRRDIAQKIKNVKAQLDTILKEKDRYGFMVNQETDSFHELGRVTTSFVEIEEVKGRDNDRDILVSKLITESANASQEDQLRSIHVTSIVGPGGIGKTTLAQLVYNDNRVIDFFPLRIWIFVSDPFDEGEIAKKIVERVRGSPPSTNQLEMLLELVSESILGQKFLLVLDDVWTDDDTKWGPLKNSLRRGASGSKILVTTRNKRVAKVIGSNVEDEIHYLGQLSDEDCWLLLHHKAFSRRNDEKLLLDIGRKISNKCKGLPLAAKVLGSLLQFKNTAEEWMDVLENDIWKLEKMELDLFPHLLLSYNDLSLAQKRCFSYCAIFPKDYEIDVDELIRYWMALGYLSSGGGDASELELRGREFFDNLAMRSLFQDFEKDDYNEHIIVKCKMHDIVHDFAQFLRKSDMESSSEIVLKKTSSKTCNHSSHSQIKEYRSSFPFMKEQPSLHICDCLTSLRILSLIMCGLESIPKEIEKLIHLRYLNLCGNRLSRVEDVKTICILYNLETLILCYCDLKEIPTEIGDLIKLRHLDLSSNFDLTKLPESIGDLHELRSLDLDFCGSLFETSVLSKLTGLRKLAEFHAGRDRGKLEWLKKLDRLSGYLNLFIKLADGMVADAHEAELRKKMHLRELKIYFHYEEEKYSCMSFDVLDALEPHPNLRRLHIHDFRGSKFPDWIVSPLYQLTKVTLRNCNNCSLLPPLGLLPLLEELEIDYWDGLQFVGREFLGITMQPTSSSTSRTLIGFPKLKTLKFTSCLDWKQWEDITMEEEVSSSVSVMPCLIELTLWNCRSLMKLPHRLLRKAVSIKKLKLHFSLQLQQCYEDKECFFWKSISHIPQVEFKY